jgi:hypothetical protein
MQFADTQPLLTTVKLFPRLAMAHAARKPVIRRFDRVPRPLPAGGDLSREECRRQVRARLLRMIVDNEQVRRNEQRPTAS